MGLNTVFNSNNLELIKMKRVLKKVNSYKSYMETLSDEKLKSLTTDFKLRLSCGESLDEILPEAFAAMREAVHRVLGLFAYDVQILGAITLHNGNIAEMKTGEGKTLTAIFPAYLNSLTGKGVIVITSNEYLAKRDAEEMQGVFKFMDVTICAGLEDDENKMTKQEIYNHDIVYTTQSTLGFDYLFDNLANRKEDKFLREFNYAIIDEIDAVLLDSAQMPLIIAGSPKVQSNLYPVVQKFVETLEEGIDYKKDEDDNVWYLNEGIRKSEQYFNVENLYDDSHYYLVKILNLVLKANVNMTLDKDYVVKDNKIKLLDKETGRILEGITLKNGQHQALEAKENVPLSNENRSIAAITYQNLFKLFKKISGMSGTAKVAEQEFIETYNLKVVCISTNKPVIRIDKKDKIYATLPEKIIAILEFVKKIHATGQPLLIVSGSVQATDLYSALLLNEGIAHSVLNAHNAVKEAEIISEAGELNNVTVATSMAGRGTDIKLGKGVLELGGLVVVGTERMSSKRMDQQLSGRSGRQGEPGLSQFFVSLEDELLVKQGPRWLEKYRNKKYNSIDEVIPVELSRRKFGSVVEFAQQASDDNGKQSRGIIAQYDESVKIQRKKVYDARNSLLLEEEMDFDLNKTIKLLVSEFLNKKKEISMIDITTFLVNNLNYSNKKIEKFINFKSKKEISEKLIRIIYDECTKVRSIFKNKQEEEDFIRVSILKAIDEHWVDQIDSLSILSTIVSGRTYAQKNPVYEYAREAYESYNEMRYRIKESIIRNIAKSHIERNENGELTIYFP
mgnify:FL=1